MTNKLTSEQAIENEANSLIDALGCGLELNDEFISKFCSKEVSDLLLPIDESIRRLVFADNVTFMYANGTVPSNDNRLLLPCVEIVEQFEGKAKDWFENPEDWTINGNLAYLYIGYGLSFTVDIDSLKEDIGGWTNN